MRNTNACFVAMYFVALLFGCAESESPEIVSELRTHFVDHGNGEPVVLVHGFSQTHAIWFDTPLYEDLIRDHRLIAVDLRGHGDSGKPHDPADYGPNLHRDLVALLDHLDIDKAHFVGFSMGANVVGDLLVSAPERVRTATMGSGFFTSWDEAEEEFAHYTENREPGIDHAPWEPENQDYRALAAAIRGTRYSAVSAEQIASVDRPTLVVFGSIEVEHMPDGRREQLSNLPDSVSVLIVESADHDSEKAAILSAEFTRAVRNHIATKEP